MDALPVPSSKELKRRAKRRSIEEGHLVCLTFRQHDCQLVGTLAFAFADKCKGIKFLSFETNHYGEKFAVLNWKTAWTAERVSYWMYDTLAKRKYIEHWDVENEWDCLSVYVNGRMYGARTLSVKETDL